MVESSAVLPGGSSSDFSAISATDIMQEEVIWAGPDDTVKQALAKMQQQISGEITGKRRGLSDQLPLFNIRRLVQNAISVDQNGHFDQAHAGDGHILIPRNTLSRV